MDIGGLIGGISGIVQNLQTFGNMDLQNRAQIQNAQMTMHNWQRDDNAVQRRVADLKKAGLSPTLAAGSAASTSQPIKAEAPQMEGLEKAPLAVMQMLKMNQDFKTSKEQAKTLHAQARNFISQMDKNNLDTAIKEHDLGIAKDLGIPYSSNNLGGLLKVASGLIKSFQKTDYKKSVKSKGYTPGRRTDVRTGKKLNFWENAQRIWSGKKH